MVDEIIDGRASADDSGTGRLTDWLADYTPHIALIHLGTNDVWAGQDTESTVSELETIIDILHADNASVTILLAKLIPIDNRSIQLGIDARNGEIDGIAIRKITAASPVLVVEGASPKMRRQSRTEKVEKVKDVKRCQRPDL